MYKYCYTFVDEILCEALVQSQIWIHFPYSFSLNLVAFNAEFVTLDTADAQVKLVLLGELIFIIHSAMLI